MIAAQTVAHETAAIVSVAAKATLGRQEIVTLAGLASEAEVIDRLKKITSAYGKVLSVTRLQLANTDEMHNKHLYMVDYTHSKDAMAAAQSMRCYLYGFSTLIVVVPRSSTGS